MENAINKLGRRIRLGVVGGGGAALIGPVHRAAARLDDLMEVTAGVLSSNAERSLAEAERLMIPRGYADLGTMLGGFNIIEADSMEEALRIAEEFPWVRTGSIEVRPVRDIQAVRTRVGADTPDAAARGPA